MFKMDIQNQHAKFEIDNAILIFLIEYNYLKTNEQNNSNKMLKRSPLL